MLKAVVELTRIRAVAAKSLNTRPVPAGGRKWTYERIAQDLGLGGRNVRQRGANVVKGSRTQDPELED